MHSQVDKLVRIRQEFLLDLVLAFQILEGEKQCRFWPFFDILPDSVLMDGIMHDVQCAGTGDMCPFMLTVNMLFALPKIF